MDYIADLGTAIRAAMAERQPASSTGTAVGKISGDHVLINGQYYRAIWGGDFDALDGQQVDVILGDGACIIVGIR